MGLLACVGWLWVVVSWWGLVIYCCFSLFSVGRIAGSLIVNSVVLV